MDDPVAVTSRRMLATFARLGSEAVDALSSAIAGFALLAGARAFMFTALLGWREPVLGGAGLVVLALIGWLRWRCGAAACAAVSGARHSGPGANGVDGSCRGVFRPTAPVPQARTEARNDACYNRLKQCDSSGPAWSESDVVKPEAGSHSNLNASGVAMQLAQTIALRYPNLTSATSR